MIPLAVLQDIIDASGAAPRVEAMLPAGVRARQLTVRTLLAGMCLAQADHRPAHLTRVHQAPVSLTEDDQWRLGVITDWKQGPHLLTYRQTEYTFGLVAAVLGKDEPDGLPSMTLDRDRPEILTPPEHPQACCTRQTLTIPPQVNVKTRQKHDYPSAAHRRSYPRRTGAERGFATAKDPATNDISRGWCRLMGLTPLTLFTATLLIVRNQRILHAWNARQEENERRAAAGLPPKTRKRRRRTLAALAAGPP